MSFGPLVIACTMNNGQPNDNNQRKLTQLLLEQGNQPLLLVLSIAPVSERRVQTDSNEGKQETSVMLRWEGIG